MLLVNGDAMRIPLADGSVHCIATSPPYWGLRSYGHWHMQRLWGSLDDFTMPRSAKKRARWWFDIRWRAAERGGIFSSNGKSWIGAYGLEPTPEMYVDHTVDVFREVWRVLRDDGTLWLNIGDSYAANQKGGEKSKPGDKSYTNKGGVGLDRFYPKHGLKPKDLVGIPWMVAFALRADGWWLRSDIVWNKPNPMPESVRDRPTKSHEYLFLLSKSERYFYDQDSIREPVKDITLSRLSQPNFDNQEGGDKDPKSGNRSERRTLENLKERYHKQGVWEDRFTGYELWKEKGIGRNRRTVWEIATAPYSGAHFATFPPALVEPCINAGTSERGVCPECGAPWERVVDIKRKAHESMRVRSGAEARPGPIQTTPGIAHTPENFGVERTTTGWQPTCDHAAEPVPATAFDPFAGSGTTLQVARQLGRHGIGLDLSLSYLRDQARARLELDKLDAWQHGKKNGGGSVDDLPLFATQEQP